MLPGAPAFAVIADTAAGALAGAHPGADPFAAAAMLWACLHGIIALRADRPAFPWPPLDAMIDSLVRQIIATPPQTSPSGTPPSARSPPGPQRRHHTEPGADHRPAG